MFVIKNKDRNYACYLTEENTWKGLLQAKFFKTKEEAEKVLNEYGEIVNFEELVKPVK